MIVKIQTSLDSSDGVQKALIYNKDKSVQYGSGRWYKIDNERQIESLF